MSKSEKTGNIASRVRELLEDTITGLGYTVWDLEYVKEAGDMILRITIDKDGIIDLDDCERVTRAVDPLLDEADPIPVSYRLEVSSPGLERVIRTNEHLIWANGKKIRIKLFHAASGANEFVGELISHDDESITLLCGEGEKTFSRKDISRIITVFDFEQEGLGK